MFGQADGWQSTDWQIRGRKSVQPSCGNLRHVALTTDVLAEPQIFAPPRLVDRRGVLSVHTTRNVRRNRDVKRRRRRVLHIPAIEVTSLSTHIDPEPHHDDIMYPQVLPFLLVHVGCLAAIWSGHLMAGNRNLRRAVLAAHVCDHRRVSSVLSHRAYATSRAFQFILAFLAQSSAQKSVLWWAAKHRHHHLHSDTEHDVHSPRTRASCTAISAGFSTDSTMRPDLTKVSDFAAYPELRWLQ